MNEPWPVAGEVLLRVTAAACVACYAVRALIDLSGARADCWQHRARILWTIGGLLLATHLACAFHFRHGWSHAAAWEHTRARTMTLTGWNTGVGLYANEVMAVLWLLDVLGWWIHRRWPNVRRGWYWMMQGFFAFMIVNATVVFGPWYWGPVLAGFVGAWAVLRCQTNRG